MEACGIYAGTQKPHKIKVYWLSKKKKQPIFKAVWKLLRMTGLEP